MDPPPVEIHPGRRGPIGGPEPDGAWSLRYISCIELSDGRLRLYYETRRRDGAHDLRTEYVPPSW
jgi:hypothetical protein